MGTEDVKVRYETIRDDVIEDLFDAHISPKVPEEDWDVEGLQGTYYSLMVLTIQLKECVDEGMDVDEILKMIQQGFVNSHEVKEKNLGVETMRTFEKAVMLRALDHHWKEHLAIMDQLRQSVNLRAIGQKNPIQEFKRESFLCLLSFLKPLILKLFKRFVV